MKLFVYVFAAAMCLRFAHSISLRENLLLQVDDAATEDKQYGLSESQKQGIVRMFNTARSRANPEAARMNEVVWDESVARQAQAYIMDCQTLGNYPQYSPGVYNLYRDSGKNPVDIAKIRSIEQSRYYNSTTGDCIVQGPPKLMRLLNQKCSKIHIYQAIMYEDIDKIGCGMAFCGGPKVYMHACAVTLSKPYADIKGPHTWTAGTPCSNCPQDRPFCNKNLCTSKKPQ